MEGLVVNNFFYIVFFVLISIHQISSAGEVQSLIEDITYMDPIEVKDPRIEQVTDYDADPVYVNGHECQPYKSSPVDDSHNIRYGGKNRYAVPFKWSLAQWNSKADLYSSHGSYNGNNVYRWENYYKVFQIGKSGSGSRGIIMGVNGAREYGGVWGYEQHEKDPCYETPHPALLFSQKLTDLGNGVKFGKTKKILLKMGTRVTKENITAAREAEWDKSKATAHFKIHINVQYLRDDKNKSLGHGQGYGLSINYFDVRNRDKDYEDGDFLHKPQKRYMYNVALADLAGSNARSKLHNQSWVNFEVDIRPILQDAFNRAINYGKTSEYVAPLIQESFGQYVISSINFGWEVSSLHDVEMHISDFELNAEMK